MTKNGHPYGRYVTRLTPAQKRRIETKLLRIFGRIALGWDDAA